MSSRATALALAIAITVLCSTAEARVIHKERSLYSTVLVDQTGSMRCLAFSVKRDQRRQTCMDERDPKRMVFSYTRMMMAALLFNPTPKRVLVIGLGGGTLPAALTELYPDVAIDAVEIDAAVVRVAEEYFNYTPHEHTRVIVSDGRLFARRQSGKTSYDLILLDAFNGEYIPEHLMTREFLESMRGLLTDDGVLAANTFTESELYHSESVTYEAVFGRFYNFKLPETGNRVILAGKRPLPGPETLSGRAADLDQRLAAYGVYLSDYLDRIDGRRDWRTSARVLTDQYAPANLLRQR